MAASAAVPMLAMMIDQRLPVAVEAVDVELHARLLPMMTTMSELDVVVAHRPPDRQLMLPKESSRKARDHAAEIDVTTIRGVEVIASNKPRTRTPGSTSSITWIVPSMKR